MADEVYLMHCSFCETDEEVVDWINNFGYVTKDVKAKNRWLVPMERSYNKITWVYLPRAIQTLGLCNSIIETM